MAESTEFCFKYSPNFSCALSVTVIIKLLLVWFIDMSVISLLKLNTFYLTVKSRGKLFGFKKKKLQAVQVRTPGNCLILPRG